MSRTPPTIIAISLEPNDASTTLFLGHLAARMPAALEVVRYGDARLWQKIGQARAIILVRGLFELSGVVTAARMLGIPHYYFLDDNFMLLREEAGPWTPFVQRYSVANVKSQLQSFSGVLLSSHALVEYFRTERLHQSVTFFPPVEWPVALPGVTSASDRVSIAFFGGHHLHNMFSACVLPAIRRLAAERPVTLVAVGMTQRIAPSTGLTVTEQPYEPSYASGVRRLAAEGVNVLVHPSPSELRNGRYKIPHALLSANALGAIPVVSNRAPYDHLHGAGVAMLCDDSAESWYAALAEAAVPSRSASLRERLAAHCASHYGGQVNQQVVNQMVAGHDAPPAALRGLRALTAGALILAGRVTARFGR